jgi:hypothetical protein
LLTPAFLNSLCLLYKSRGIIHASQPLTILLSLLFIFFYPLSNNASISFFVNKSLYPSSYAACFLTLKYGNLRLTSPIPGVREIMIHNVYRTGILAPTSSKLQPTKELLSLDTHRIFSVVHAALSNDSLGPVLLGDFNIHHPHSGGPRARPYYASQLLLSLQELHSFALLLPSEAITCRKYGSKSTTTLYFPHNICLSLSQLAAQWKTSIMGLTISLLKQHSPSPLMSLLLSLSHSGERQTR